jgi:endonuclease/exonuclease/phosphatase family metal-dependent hydrolase
MKVVGCYFDDLSEDVRLKQAEAVLGYDPDAIAGDLNATHGKEKLSASMRAFCTEAILRTTALSPVQPDILRCIQGMREGRVLSLLKREGFVDADSMRRPTSPLLSRAVPFLQLDHVMAQSRTLEVLSFWSEGTAEDADHKAIATSLRKRAA